MKILIIKLSAVGDVVMSLPAFQALRRAFPRAELTWLVEEAASDLLVDLPGLDRVLISRRKSWLKAFKQGDRRAAFREMAGFLKEVRAGRYDVVLDLQGLFKSGILAFFSGGPRRVGFDRTRELSWLFVNDRLPPYDPDRHALLRYMDAARYLGASEEVVYRFPEHPAAAEEAERLLGPKPGRMVVLNPGAKWPTKLWPTDYWRDLGQKLAGRPDLKLVMTGSPDEREANSRAGRDVPGLLDLTGRTSLKALAEIFRRADLVVCPDTGPMHLAAAVGTPVAALFGPTSPDRTGPYGSGHLILRAGLDCRPCFRKACPDPKCMTGLTPDLVFEAVVEKLENPGPEAGTGKSGQGVENGG